MTRHSLLRPLRLPLLLAAPASRPRHAPARLCLPARRRLQHRAGHALCDVRQFHRPPSPRLRRSRMHPAPRSGRSAQAGAGRSRARTNLGVSKVYDCYRPTRAVRAMAAWAHDGDDSAATKRFYPELQKRNLFRLGYIAAQSKHSTGTTVDLTLIRRPAAAAAAFDPAARYGPCTGPAAKRAPDNSIDMGTGFDCFDLRSYGANRRSHPSRSAGAPRSPRPCAGTALRVTSANGGTFHSPAPTNRAPMISRSGRGGDERAAGTASIRHHRALKCHGRARPLIRHHRACPGDLA